MVSKTEKLIEEKKYIAFKDTCPNGELNYLRMHEGRYVCQLCKGFHSGTHIKKESIVSHHQLYHSSEENKTMKSENEIRKRLSALQGTKALLKGQDLSRVDAGIRTLEWVLGDKE